ncbi:hypothetical protein IM774_08450 [Erysipelotrichaceae bacterium RD49]|nr:hypothetical protein [Erysipelotrichaceae bacterium RD49]
METIQDWKQDTNEALFQDDEQEERSTRETITAIAAHQIGNKASHDNYQVADDGKTRIGITRYGQWDDDPYQENWSSSFVRYVLHFAQADEATKDAPKDLYDWMSQLSDSQQLLTIDNAEAGDVLFVLDQKDATIAKAAIIEQEDENELVAIGQDAKDEVARHTYNRDDPLLHSIYKPVETSKGAFEENTPEDKKSVSKSPAADEEADNSKTPYNQNANPKSSDDEIKDNELALFDSSQKDSEFEDEKPDAFLKNNEKFDMKQNDTDDDNDAETNNSEKEQNQRTLDEKTSDAAKPSTSSPSGKDSNHLQTSTSKSDDLTNPKKNDANQSSTSSKSSLNNTTPSGSDQKDSKNSEESKTSQKNKDESSKEADSRNTNSQATNQTNHSDQHQADDDDLTATKQILDIQTVQKDSEQTKAQAIADDGTIVQAKWNPGTFEEETVVFQAKVKQTEPDVEKQVLESLQAEDADQYQAITYDLTFYRRGENAELEEIEPNGTILVTFGFTQDIKHVDSIYHYPASKRLEKMNLEQVNNKTDSNEVHEAKQTQNRIPESPKAKQSSSNALTSLDKEDNAQDSTNSNDNAGQASETSKDQDSNLELNQDSKPESNKPSSGSKPDSDKDSDSKSTNPPASLGECKPGENSNFESQSDSEQNTDIDPADTKESEPNQAADSTKGSQTNPDQTSSVQSTAKQADQTVSNPTDSSSVSTKAANEIRTSITAALKQSLQIKPVEVKLTDLTSNPAIQVVQFETDSFSEYVAIVKEDLTYDFTQEVEAEDGSRIKVSWNEGTFETDDVVFQAKTVELTEEELKKVQEQLDQDKNYTFRNYDLSFYMRNESMELTEIEPALPVNVEITQIDGSNNSGNKSIFHFKNGGELEKVQRIEETDKNSEISINQTDRFKLNSFSSITIAEETNNSRAARVTRYANSYLELENLAENNDNAIIYVNGDYNGNQCINITNKKNLVIDFQGHRVESTIKNFYVDNSTVTFQNSSMIICTGTPGQNAAIQGVNNSNISVINCTVQNDADRAIQVTNSTLNISNSAVQWSKGGIFADHSKVTVSGGSVNNNTLSDQENESQHASGNKYNQSGAGICAVNGSTVELTGGVNIHDNSTKTTEWAFNAIDYGGRGGGIYLEGTSTSCVRNHRKIRSNR